MATYTSIEQKLLLTAGAGDLAAVIEIVSHLSPKEKEAVDVHVFDAVLHSIVQHAKIDQAESAYATMMFIRTVGRYTSPAAVSAMLQNAPLVALAPQRRYTDNLQQLPTQAAIMYEFIGSALRRRTSDHA